MANLASQFTSLPNLVTMGRVALIPGTLFFIDNYSPLRSFIAALLYLVSASTDALDGYLARSRGQVSVLGKFLDPLADKLLVTAVLVFMVGLGRVPAWIVVVMIARDLAVNGLRSVASAEGLVIAASDGGRIKTALQLVALMMLLVHFRYPILGMDVSVDYHQVGMSILYVSLAMSVLTGIDYMRRFIAVLTRAEPPPPAAPPPRTA
jgi:CDP-diacylglycerol--glycerol-3-phosphate 3-phosphatidyltransferase